MTLDNAMTTATMWQANVELKLNIITRLYRSNNNL